MPYVQFGHTVAPHTSLGQPTSAEFQQFLMWKQQQEFQHWQQQQQKQKLNHESQWAVPLCVPSPIVFPDDQYRQFLQWQQSQLHQQCNPETTSGSSTPAANQYSLVSGPSATPSLDPYECPIQPTNVQSQQYQSAPSSTVVQANTQSNVMSISNVATSDVANASTMGNTTATNNKTSSASAGCFNPITSLIGLMGVATDTMNNITNYNNQTKGSFDSMKKAFVGMIDTFQSLGQIAGGCTKL
ncbi:hypothetical protein IV203_007529 [Nitzschia inconspicua]|uniref:Uncharacterized protein n=1 Tax=Nitzschia inconspicua TaxID=303405 RepID=A0A9K3KFT6_9STRA|nr:hypothetical protein IV203_007529 [Nitzschia inconspicua]